MVGTCSVSCLSNGHVNARAVTEYTLRCSPARAWDTRILLSGGRARKVYAYTRLPTWCSVVVRSK